MSQYASWIMEYEREKLGLDRKDDSRDEEIIKSLQSGIKISKSVHYDEQRQKDDEESLKRWKEDRDDHD